MKNSLFIVLAFGLFVFSCSSSTDESASDKQAPSENEFEAISKNLISAMSQENASDFEALFPDMDFSEFRYSSAAEYISGVKNKFIEEAGLAGWNQMKAVGYLINEDTGGFDIVAEDGNGRQFILNGLNFTKDGNNYSFEVWDNDVYTLESFKEQGGQTDQITWF